MLDGILIMVIILPIQFLTGYFARVQAQEASIVEQFMMSLLGIVAFLFLNGFLLHSRGQTIGKVATKIQIVDVVHGRLLPFMQVYVFRYLWTLPLVFLVILIPGVFDDLLMNFVILIDVLLIFRSDRRCLHDILAGSKVVAYKANRSRL